MTGHGSGPLGSLSTLFLETINVKVSDVNRVILGLQLLEVLASN